LELVSVLRNLILLRTQEKKVRALNKHLTEDVLKRYLPPALVDAISAGRVNLDQEPAEQAVTVLFADLVGFTGIVARSPPDLSGRLLNDFLKLMGDVVLGHGGTIDKFVGDQVMALFGAPTAMPPAAQCQRALDAGMAMQASLLRLHATWSSKISAPLSLRVGIHHGPALVGNFGNASRSDYTAIGNTVNVASRIESWCEPGAVSVSATVAHYCRRKLTPHGPQELRGVQGLVELFSMHPLGNQSSSPERPIAHRRHARVLANQLKVHVQVVVSCAGSMFEATISDLSNSGLGVVVTDDDAALLANIDEVEMQMEADGRKQMAIGAIRARRSVEEGTFLGVEFKDWADDAPLQAWIVHVHSSQYWV
jgi:class 3 adenylate cyclase